MMKMEIRDASAIPYGGSYRLELPGLGLVGAGRTFDELLGAIERYRQANGLPVGLGLREEVEQAVCASYPAECRMVYPVNVPAPQKLGWRTVLQGTLLMSKHLAAGSPLVSQEEADRRAGQCAKCPWCRETQFPCVTVCGELEKAVRLLIGAKVTSSEGAIKGKNCSVCGCFCSASVFVPLELQWSVLTDAQKKAFAEIAREKGCWKGEGLA